MRLEIVFLVWFCTVSIILLLFFSLLHCRWVRRLRYVENLPPITIYNYSLEEFLGLEMEYHYPQRRVPFVS